MGLLSIAGLSKSFPSNNGNPISVVSDFSLDVADGEFVSLFGPNGCGKTTLLFVVAGVDKPDSGTVLINGESAENARIGMVFQNYRDALLPWRNNLANLCLPLEIANRPISERKEKGWALAKDLGIEIDMESYPYQLSGGQQQLLSIGRALMSDPDLLLLDEPLSSLDFQTSLRIADEIQEIWQRTRRTTLLVSHDIDDAIYLSDRICFLTERPARIHKELLISLPRPRTIKTRTSKEFFELRSRCLEIFREVVSHD